MMVTKIAALQLSTTDNLDTNLNGLQKYIQIASDNGATHIFTPENSDVMLPFKESQGYDFAYSSQKMQETISELSNKLKIFIHLGSIKVPVGNGKFYNQSLSFDNHGSLVTQYNKIHLFDAAVADGTHYYESHHIQAGDTAVMHQFSDFKIGYTICYDIRFSYLYTLYSDNNVDVITTPAAFTVPTGQAHWEVLLRSRAIENCCYIVAAAQCGTHYNKRKTYGYSMIINPWGDILCSGDSLCEKVIYADIDKKERIKVQEQLNIVGHRVRNIGIKRN
jgi:deaminated glutathione amidase